MSPAKGDNHGTIINGSTITGGIIAGGANSTAIGQSGPSSERPPDPRRDDRPNSSARGRVFVSYAFEDSDYVDPLVAYLENQQVRCWYARDLDLGRRLDDEIERAIDECAAFIVVTSPAARASHWVVAELNHALKINKRVYPLLLSGDPLFQIQGLLHEEVIGRSMPSDRFVTGLRRLVDYDIG